jgi:Helix-turn-helix domain
MLAPSSRELAKELGLAQLTCRKALQLLLATGELTRVSQSSRYRVPGDCPSGAGELSRALAARRHEAGITQSELADAIGMSETAVGHAETGRLWQSRAFWEKVDGALNADGDLVARHAAWRSGSAADTTTGQPAMSAATVEPDAPGGVVITLPGGPVPVTVIWADGSATTVRPAPAQAGAQPG